uniref:50S ribosomal protein L6 n=1 Tax=Nephromyces sp. ex Molgula occidentalis TaxID=2544991 RepID=A0A5C1H8G1_9APIC|nr:50S ribosomal protein L6 [Nephromyces sp. ex Molgula occidentalis]
MIYKILLPSKIKLYLIKDLKTKLIILIFKQEDKIFYLNVRNIFWLYLGQSYLFIDTNIKTKFLIKSLESFLSNFNLISRTKLYIIELILIGIGYYFKLINSWILQIKVKYNHVINFYIPINIKFIINNNGTQLKIIGNNKNLVSLVASRIKHINIPDNYKNKGIRYSYEKLYLKTIKKQKKK